MAEAAIVVKDLVKRFGKVTAVDGVSFEVTVGTVTGFLGLNGAGKTTTLNILAGVGSQTAGEAWIVGEKVTRTNIAARRAVGFLPEEPSLPGWMTAREAVQLAAELSGLRGMVARERRDYVLEETGLADVAHRKVAGFSRGMRQRLGLAQAILHDPPVLLLDEPSSALDPSGRRDVLELIQRLRGQRTVLLSTHILADVQRVCDHVIVVHQGRLVAEAPIREMLDRVAPPVAEIDLLSGGAEARAALESHPWVERVEVEPMADRTRLRLYPSAGQAAKVSLPAAVAEYGAALMRYEWVTPDLEAVFLDIVGDKEAPKA